jgi:hypothetical protein
MFQPTIETNVDMHDVITTITCVILKHEPRKVTSGPKPSWMKLHECFVLKATHGMKCFRSSQTHCSEDGVMYTNSHTLYLRPYKLWPLSRWPSHNDLTETYSVTFDLTSSERPLWATWPPLEEGGASYSLQSVCLLISSPVREGGGGKGEDFNALDPLQSTPQFHLVSEPKFLIEWRQFVCNNEISNTMNLITGVSNL